jgi:hypothetical protein
MEGRRWGRIGFLWLAFPLRLPIKYEISASVYSFLLGPPRSCWEGVLKIIPKAR